MQNKKTTFNLLPKIYKSKSQYSKGNIFYFHGGGLLFGTKFDLPKYHIDKITEAGYNILSFNYPLMPESNFHSLMDQVICSINSYAEIFNGPYFLWGRSAGAYLCLFSISRGLNIKPNGIISYYGYGFLTPNWYDTPNSFYLKYPRIEFMEVKNLIENEPLYQSPVNPRFLIYLYARQTGNWLKLISGNSKIDFSNEYSLMNVDFSNYPPVFLAHNIKDNDVPYEESIELSLRLKDFKLFICTTLDHDFDRDTESIHTIKVINDTITFMNNCI